MLAKVSHSAFLVLMVQTFSSFFRFPITFMCGLFIPIMPLPMFIRPLFFALPLIYDVGILHGAVHGGNIMSNAASLLILGAFCIGLFVLSLHSIRRKWIV